MNHAVNPFDSEKQQGKRGAVESPEGHKSKRSNIDDWQVQEFVWAFLEGTATSPNYTNLTWELEDTNVLENEVVEIIEEENDDEAASLEEEGDVSFDTK